MTSLKPDLRPLDPRFSPGPTRKRPGWRAEAIAAKAALGRNHRSAAAVERIVRCTDLIREVLEIPDDYRIAIVPGSDTGAVEAAMWSLLGARGVDVFAWENFGRDWVVDAVEQLKPHDLRVFTADYGQLPPLEEARPDRDVVFTWNGTTSGVTVPGADWIADDRSGVTICDATSTAFAARLPWDKLDATTYSWQKVMGGEAAHGVLILSPRAMARLESDVPPWPVPKLFRLAENGVVSQKIFEGQTINTPSLWCVEDHIDALEWALSIGGLEALNARCEASSRLVYQWLDASPWAAALCEDPALRSLTSVCLRFGAPEVSAWPLDKQRDLQMAMLAALEQENAGLDLGAYRTAPPGLRIWCGATVEAEDVAALLPWLDWAYDVALSRQAAA